MVFSYKNIPFGNGTQPPFRTLVDSPARSPKGLVYWDDTNGSFSNIKVQGRIVDNGPWCDLVTLTSAGTLYEFTVLPFIRIVYTSGTGTISVHFYW